MALGMSPPEICGRRQWLKVAIFKADHVNR
jgi:hypothetical protein